jgi:hypothetical protein
MVALGPIEGKPHVKSPSAAMRKLAVEPKISVIFVSKSHELFSAVEIAAS